MEYFKQMEDDEDDVAQVRYDYYKQKRKTKLFQIENALNGNSENVFMSVGLNLNNVQALQMINIKTKAGQDRSVDKLIESIA